MNHLRNTLESRIIATLKMNPDLSEDELYKCVLCLYNIFKVIYTDKPIQQKYIDRLNDIKSTTRFMKIKFKIMDILERR